MRPSVYIQEASQHPTVQKGFDWARERATTGVVVVQTAVQSGSGPELVLDLCRELVDVGNVSATLISRRQLRYADRRVLSTTGFVLNSVLLGITALNLFVISNEMTRRLRANKSLAGDTRPDKTAADEFYAHAQVKVVSNNLLQAKNGVSILNGRKLSRYGRIHHGVLAGLDTAGLIMRRYAVKT